MDPNRVKEEFELYLEFEDIITIDNNTSKLQNAIFHGPVLISNLVIIAEEDEILLDFSHQYKILLMDSSYYSVVVSWSGREFIEDNKVITLTNCILKYHKDGLLSKINKDTFFLIDTENHTDLLHAKFPAYRSWLLNSEGMPLGY